eukprot:355086-Chlamydomonas_euryale.AAC.8
MQAHAAHTHARMHAYTHASGCCTRACAYVCAAGGIDVPASSACASAEVCGFSVQRTMHGRVGHAQRADIKIRTLPAVRVCVETQLAHRKREYVWNAARESQVQVFAL